MQYEEPKRLTQTEAEQIFASGVAGHIQGALIAMALHEPDWRWVQQRCMAFTAHPDPGVRAIAATSLGHVARVHGRLDVELVMPRLEALLRDPLTAGYAEAALDDVKMFVR